MQMLVPAAEVLNLAEADLLCFTWVRIGRQLQLPLLGLASKLGWWRMYLLLCEYSLNIQIDHWIP